MIDTMQDQNHRTIYNTLRTSIQRAILVASLAAMSQPCLAGTQQDQRVSDVDLKGKEIFSPWYQDDFYKQHRNDPEYEFGSPEKAKKAFLNNKYVMLRNKIVEELLVVARNVMIMMAGSVIMELYIDKILAKLSEKLAAYGLDAPLDTFFATTRMVERNGRHVRQEGLYPDNSFPLLLMKYLYKSWGTRGIATPYKAITSWERDDVNVVVRYFLKNLFTLFICQVPFYSQTSKDMTLSSVLITTLINPIYGILGVLLLYAYRMRNTHILPMINFWRFGDTVETLDDMQEAELLYIENEHRMSEEMQNLIEKLLLQARKYPEKRPMLLQIIRYIVSLPTQEEATAPNAMEGTIDLSTMYAYEKQVIDYAYRLCYRSVEGINKMHHPYFLGTSGVGKTFFVELLANALGAKVARVSFAGVHVKELIGYSQENGKKGYIGRIAEAIQEASAYGKYPVILFIDELDKALDGPYAEEINALCLELFESNTLGFKNSFLDNRLVYYPNIIIFAGNKDLTGPLKDRVETVSFYGYDWAAKRLVIYGTKSYKGKLDSLCKELGLNRSDLNKKDYKAIEKIFNEMEKEEAKVPAEQQDKGVRQLEIRILRYLFLTKLVKDDYKRLKAQMKRHVKNLPPVEAF